MDSPPPQQRRRKQLQIPESPGSSSGQPSRRKSLNNNRHSARSRPSLGHNNSLLNDDEAEKRARRRKSNGKEVVNKNKAKQAVDADDEDDSEEEVYEDAEEDFVDEQHANKPKSKSSTGKPPRLSMRKPLNIIAKPTVAGNGLAAAVGALTANTAAGAAANASAMARVVTEMALPKMSIETMSNNFEEWMKMATDNKITATNTWNFALIDYFADLTLLRNGPDDQSINFQKASATLDGCVKVWTSRVDSVATETGKLLSGLSTGGSGRGGDGGDEDGDEDGDEEGEGEGGPGEGTKKKRKAHRSEATLAKSFAPLKLKKFDLEFTVDPLFKKTCADFDEGGAMGLLMNHLGVDGKGRLIFDAGDVEVGEKAGTEEEEGNMNVEDFEEDADVLDMEKLTDFINMDDVNDRNISVTLADFKFTADPNETFTLNFLSHNDREEEEADRRSDSGDAPGGIHDFFGAEELGEDFGGIEDYGTPVGNGDDEDGMGGDGHYGDACGDGPLEPYDATRRGGDLVMAMMGDGGNEEMMLDYFDKGLLKNWAGPEHWKLRRVTRKTDMPGGPVAPKASRKEKTPFLIDFAAPSEINTKTLFTPGTKAAISQPASKGRRISGGGKKKSKKAAKEEERSDEYLLPDDMHFSSRQLLRLFLKPKFGLQTRGRRGEAAVPTQNEDGEIDENFWAQAAADQAQAGDMGDDDDDNGGESGPMPFETQFFHDEDDDGGDFAEVDEGLGGSMGGADEEDLWAGTQGQVKRIKPESVNYAKRAKRVDVKRLKDNIWKGLDIVTSLDTEGETDSEAEPVTPMDDSPQERTFDTVIQNLRGTYAPDKMSEISTSFCFICLLHLANEQGLKIEAAQEELYDGEKEDNIIGELQTLKITKDKGEIQPV